ncbi:MAG TPA: carboxypeptidase regulatory-like domain-containing protein, partial [Gemmatimonadaceae bacterium]|nr:carboxypeptidase regulatory-like domain-containing protein [Gemmatimonadaceae bacterium]
MSHISWHALLGGSLAIALGLWAPGLAAQEPSGVIAGRVTDTASVPVANAMLHVLGGKVGSVSGDDGRYRIVGLPPGRVSIVVRRQGFVTDTFALTVAAGETVEHDVSLRSIPISLAQVVVTASPR